MNIYKSLGIFDQHTCILEIINLDLIEIFKLITILNCLELSSEL